MNLLIILHPKSNTGIKNAKHQTLTVNSQQQLKTTPNAYEAHSPASSLLASINKVFITPCIIKPSLEATNE